MSDKFFSSSSDKGRDFHLLAHCNDANPNIDTIFQNSQAIDSFIENLKNETNPTKIYENLLYIRNFFRKHGFKGNEDEIKILSVLFHYHTQTESFYSVLLLTLIDILNNKQTNIESLPIDDIKAIIQEGITTDSSSLSYFTIQLCAFMSKKEELVDILFEIIPIDYFLENIQNNEYPKYTDYCLDCICNLTCHKCDEIEKEFIHNLIQLLNTIISNSQRNTIEIALDIIYNISSSSDSNLCEIISSSPIIDNMISFIQQNDERISTIVIRILKNLFQNGFSLDCSAIPEIIFSLTSSKSIKLLSLSLSTIAVYIKQSPECPIILQELGLFDKLNELYNMSQIPIQNRIIQILYNIVEADNENIAMIIDECNFIPHIIDLISCSNPGLSNNIIQIFLAFIEYDERIGKKYQIKEMLMEYEDLIADACSSENEELSNNAQSLFETLFPLE